MTKVEKNMEGFYEPTKNGGINLIPQKDLNLYKIEGTFDIVAGCTASNGKIFFTPSKWERVIMLYNPKKGVFKPRNWNTMVPENTAVYMGAIMPDKRVIVTRSSANDFVGKLLVGDKRGYHLA
jgi:hypothetical protein